MTPGQVRLRALKWMAVSLAVAGVWTVFVLWVFSTRRNLWGPGLGVPLVPVLVLGTELVSGRSFAEISGGWDQLKGWQRFLLGVAILAIAITVIIVGIVLALTIAGVL